VIRDAIIHMNNEQPLKCDLRALPTSVDACLMCTNLRYLSGAKPSFIDHADSWFLIPLGIVRFVEVPATAIMEAEGEGVLALPSGLVADELPTDDGFDQQDFAAETDLLRRMREA
jgi:hypothetical protein